MVEQFVANEQVGSSSLLSRSNLKNAKFRFCVFFMSAIKSYQGLLSSSLISVSKDTVSCWRVTKKKSGYKPRVLMVKIRNMMKLPRRAAIQVFPLLFFRDLIIAE